MLWYVRMG